MEEETTTTRKVSLTVVTNSELQTFRDCPRKWGFAYVEGLRPRHTPRALTFGQAFHAGLEVLYRTIGAVPADEVLQRAREQGQLAIRHRFAEWVTLAEDDPNVQIDSLYEDAKESLETASWMFGHYLETFRADITRIVPIAVEHPFRVPLRNARGRVLPNLVHAGVIDLLAYDPEYGDLVTYDHKTTSSEVSAIDRRVELDPQMGGYLNAVAELLRGDLSGVVRDVAAKRQHHPRLAEALDALTSRSATIGRVSYNVVRKKRPSEPKVNKDGTVSTAAIDTLPDYYERALAEQAARGVTPKGETAAKQAEILERLRSKGDSFIGRREFFKTGREIEAWRSETFEQARILRAAEREPSMRWRNAGHCSNPWSLPCAYRSVCIDDAPELRASFVVSPRHAEVEAASGKLESTEE